MYIFRKPVHNRFVDDVKTGLETETKVSTNAVYREPVCTLIHDVTNNSCSSHTKCIKVNPHIEASPAHLM